MLVENRTQSTVPPLKTNNARELCECVFKCMGACVCVVCVGGWMGVCKSRFLVSYFQSCDDEKTLMMFKRKPEPEFT